MKNTILEIAYKAQIVSKNTAEQIQAIVRTNVDEKNLERVKTGAIQASHVIADIGKEAVQYKFIQDAAKGAAVGALVAVPIPLVGPMVCGIFWASS